MKSHTGCQHSHILVLFDGSVVKGKHLIDQSIVNKEESGLECEQSYRHNSG
jgi:hypothetical protein